MADLAYIGLDVLRAQVLIGKLLGCNFIQRICWPFCEPVNGGAVHQACTKGLLRGTDAAVFQLIEATVNLPARAEVGCASETSTTAHSDLQNDRYAIRPVGKQPKPQRQDVASPEPSL